MRRLVLPILSSRFARRGDGNHEDHHRSNIDNSTLSNTDDQKQGLG